MEGESKSIKLDEFQIGYGRLSNALQDNFGDRAMETLPEYVEQYKRIYGEGGPTMAERIERKESTLLSVQDAVEKAEKQKKIQDAFEKAGKQKKKDNESAKMEKNNNQKDEL